MAYSYSTSMAAIINVQDSVQNFMAEKSTSMHFYNIDQLRDTLLSLRNCPYEETIGTLQDLIKDLKLHNAECKSKGDLEKKKKVADKEVLSDTTNSNSTNNSMQSARPSRRAKESAAIKVNQQVNVSISSKLRQETVTKINIKTERISAAPESPEELRAVANIKQELMDMPPPAALPKRAGRPKKETIKVESATRKTRLRTTTNKNDTKPEDDDSILNVRSTGKASDVILLEEPVPIIALDCNGDTENEDQNVDNAEESDKEQIEPVSTGALKKTTARGRAKKEVSKRTRSPSIEEKKTVGRPKRTKRKPTTPAKEKTPRDVSMASVYEDAVNNDANVLETQPEVNEVFKTPPSQKDSTVDEEIVVSMPTVAVTRMSEEVMNAALDKASTKTAALNETVLIEKTNPNATVVIDNPRALNATVTITKPVTNVNAADIMTDDESDEEIEKNVPVVTVKKVGQQLFNPYENSPIKKKVEAFEKLGAQAVEATVTRSTRTKTRQKAKVAEEEKEKNTAIDVPIPKAPKTGYTTPIASNRFMPSVTAGSKSNLSNSAQKTLSAIKLSSQQFRNHEQLRKEKEADAQRKKDEYLMKQSEEKRRKREEKEQKAKLQRQAMEEEKRRNNEQQRIKEEKSRQILQDKQELAKKQREESEKRRLIAKEKHEELKRQEERKRAEELRMMAKKREDEERAAIETKTKPQLPIYMTKKTPLLPTPDCYDSDDENAPRHPKLPAWQSKESIHQRTRAMGYISSQVYNTFFCVKAQTPNLIELFPNVDPRKLRRNSSAVWKQAPRFTMMAVDEDF